MKCLRCGKELPENTKVCDNCGFEVETQKTYKKIKIEVDEELDDKHKTDPFDFPILTFVFGLLSIINSLLIIFSGRPVPLIYIISFIIIFALGFFFSIKKARVSLKPVREVGVIMLYIGFAISAFYIMTWLISLI